MFVALPRPLNNAPSIFNPPPSLEHTPHAKPLAFLFNSLSSTITQTTHRSSSTTGAHSPGFPRLTPNIHTPFSSSVLLDEPRFSPSTETAPNLERDCTTNNERPGSTLDRGTPYTLFLTTCFLCLYLHVRRRISREWPCTTMRADVFREPRIEKCELAS